MIVMRARRNVNELSVLYLEKKVEEEEEDACQVLC
jgi:hypothetical protein